MKSDHVQYDRWNGFSLFPVSSFNASSLPSILDNASLSFTFVWTFLFGPCKQKHLSFVFLWIAERPKLRIRCTFQFASKQKLQHHEEEADKKTVGTTFSSEMFKISVGSARLVKLFQLFKILNKKLKQSKGWRLHGICFISWTWECIFFQNHWMLKIYNTPRNNLHPLCVLGSLEALQHLSCLIKKAYRRNMCCIARSMALHPNQLYVPVSSMAAEVKNIC